MKQTRRQFSTSLLGGTAALLASGRLPLGARPRPAPKEETRPDYDLLIKRGTVIDPGDNLRAPLDVAVREGKILELGPDIGTHRARSLVSAKGKIVTPGWIDML
jgi:hypothetical protein